MDIIGKATARHVWDMMWHPKPQKYRSRGHTHLFWVSSHPTLWRVTLNCVGYARSWYLHFAMQLRKVRPDAASDVVTQESASQHHIEYQILRDVFGSTLIGPTQKHSSSTQKYRYSTFNTVGILYINNRLWLSQKVHCLLFNVYSGAWRTRGDRSAIAIRISIQSLEVGTRPRRF
jgi:hypothetical protein